MTAQRIPVPDRRWLGRGYRFLAGGLAAAGIMLAALGAIHANLLELEATRVIEYGKLAEQIGKLAASYSALKQYDHLLDLMQLLTRTPAIRFMALEVNGAKVLQAGREAIAGQTKPWRSGGKAMSIGSDLLFWIPLDPGASRLQEKSGLRMLFSLGDLKERRRNILWISGLIALLLAALTALLQTLDQTRRRLKQQNQALLQTQEQLRREEETRSLMVRYLAHNANNHLNVVAVRLANLQAKQAVRQPSVGLEKDLAVMDENQKAVGYLIRNLYDYDLLKRGEFPLDCRLEDLAELLRRGARSIETLAAEKQIRVVCGTFTPQWLKVDARLLEQVIMNLLVNAVRYSPPGSTVDITLAPEPERVVVGIRDQGRGIAPEDRERIFEPFVRLQTHGPKGSGLGLSNARLLLKQLGGEIWVAQSRLGEGSTLAFSLPAPLTETISGGRLP
ncbi:MAG: sensor histidine kinase [Candidatus Firestonebacteria bacterium]|nr:sensor histidine kinase [Candidatus Firestonebacteria bacterium]